MKNTSFLWFYAFVLSWLAVKFGWGLNINGKAGSVISLFRSTESPSAKVIELVYSICVPINYIVMISINKLLHLREFTLTYGNAITLISWDHFSVGCSAYLLQTQLICGYLE